MKEIYVNIISNIKEMAGRLHSEKNDIDKLFNWIVGIVVIGFVILSFFFFKNVTVLWMSVSFLVILLVIHNFILLKARNDEKKTKLHAEQLTTLQQISFALTSTLHMNEVLEVIPKSAVKLAQVDGCLVELAGKMKEDVIPKAKEGIQIDLGEIDTKEEISNWVVNEKTSLIIPDLSKEPRTPNWVKNEGFVSYLGLPLKVRDEITGVLGLYTKTTRIFTPEELYLLNIFAAQAATALENARLYGVTKDALQREITSSMALFRIEQAITTSKFDIKEQLNLIMEGSTKITSTEKASIWLIDDISGEVLCKGTYPIEEKLDKSSVRIGEGITGWVAKEGVLQNIPDLNKDKRFVNPLKQDLRSQLSAPLKYKERTIGVFNVFNSKSEEGFSEADEKRFMVLASQAAVSLQTAKLYTELKTAANALSVLYEISKTISEGRELQQVLSLILKRGNEVFDAQDGSIMLLDESTNELTIKVAEGLTEEIIKNTVKKPGDGSISGWVAEKKEPLLLIGKIKDSRFKSVKSNDDVKDAMCAPLILKDKLIGVFNISNRVGTGVFTESDLNLLCTLANEVSIAIETARLYEIITQRVTELSSFYVISTALSSTLSISEILKIVLERITNLFPQLSVSISLYDEKKNQLNRIAERGFGEDKTLETELELEKIELKLKPLLEEKQQLSFSSIEDMHDLRVLVGTGKIESSLLIPLVTKGKVIGILTLVSQIKYTLLKEDLRLITAISQATASAIENAKLYKQTFRRLQELVGLQQLASKMVLTMNITEILALSVNVINEVINAELGLIFLWDEDRKEYVVKAGQGKKRVSESLFKTLKFKMGDGIVGWVGEKGQGLIIDDVRKDPRFRPIGDLYVKSLIAVPIIKDKKVIGVMKFMNKLPSGNFTNEDERMLSTIANQVAIVLNNAESFEEIKRRALQLSTVQAVNKMIVSVFGIEELLPQIVELTAKVLRVKKASLSLLDIDEHIKLEASYGLTYMEQEREEKLRIGQGIAGRVIQTNSPLLINNLPEDTTLTDDEKNIYIEKSYLSVPLNIRKKTEGALNVSTKLNDTPFNEQDIDILSTISEQSSIVIEYARLYQDVQKYSMNTLRALSLVIETRDPFTKGHSDAVARYAVEIGKQMNLSKEDLKTLELSAHLHDIGKIGVKESILLKTEKELSIEEHREIRNHPFMGAQILRPLDFLKDVIPIIYHHHERYDGDGYLDGLAGEKIPLLSRILAIADTFDAMTSTRAFRESIPDDEAIEELKDQSGKQFDPKIVEVFLKIHPIIRKDALEKIRREKEKKKREGKEPTAIGEHKVWERY